MRGAPAVLAVLALAAPAHADDAACSAEFRRLSGLLVEVGMVPAPVSGDVAAMPDGTCLVREPSVATGSVMTAKANRMTWSGEGMDRFAQDGLPPTSLSLQIEGVRFVADIGDPVMTYLMELQGNGRSADVLLRTALQALVDDMPRPAGTLRIEMTAEPGLGMARAMPLVMPRQGIGRLDDIWPLLDGVRYDVSYDRR